MARQAIAKEDVIAQHERTRIPVNELLTNDEGLSQAIRRRLLGIGQVDTKVRTILKQALEVGQILRSRNDQDVANARHHENRQRVVDHGLVVHGKQLLTRDCGERVQARARSACKNNAFHSSPFHS